jgi:hypothetical protein
MVLANEMFVGPHLLHDYIDLTIASHPHEMVLMLAQHIPKGEIRPAPISLPSAVPLQESGYLPVGVRGLTISLHVIKEGYNYTNKIINFIEKIES